MPNFISGQELIAIFLIHHNLNQVNSFLKHKNDIRAFLTVLQALFSEACRACALIDIKILAKWVILANRV
jgi:hypothetical protein